MMKERLNAAVSCYINRNRRDVHPSGNFDGLGRWLASDSERRMCCLKISPTETNPMAEMEHCRSILHVAQLYNVPYIQLWRAIRKAKDIANTYYLAVAKVDGQMLSIYDGKTQFKLGVPTKNRRPSKGALNGFYVYSTKEEAIIAEYPKSSALLSAQRIILRVVAEGPYPRKGHMRKVAFATVIPMEVVEISREDIANAVALRSTQVQGKGNVRMANRNYSSNRRMWVS